MASDPLSDQRRRADSLAGVPMFADMATETERDRDDTPLSSSPWAALASSAESHRVLAGDWLWHAGDPADSLYVVVTGRLEVIVEGPTPTVVRLLGRGGAVGELALLTESPRSAGVRARRDSELLKVSREAFDGLLNDRPEFALALARALGRQLRDAQTAPLETNPMPVTIGCIPLVEGLPVRDAASYLSLMLGGLHRVATLDGSRDDPAAWAARLDQIERDNDQVLLLATNPDPTDPWTRFCERQADRVIALTRGGPVPRGLTERARLQTCELVVIELGGHPLDPWLDALAPRNAHIVSGPDTQAAVVEALSRRLTGRSLGVVLSGGGARAFAHIGVLEELVARGLLVDRVAGCSGGAFVGGLFAMGKSPAEILEICRAEFVVRSPMDDYTVPLVAVTRGIKGGGMVQRVFGDTTIEELDREFFCVSTDMLTAELVVHRRGSLAEASAASMTLPGVFPPRRVGGRLLLDGGLLNNLPVDVMAGEGEGPVIASDVSARFEEPVAAPLGGRRRIAEVRARARAWLVGRDDPLPSLPETIVRSIVLGSQDTAVSAQRYADIVIEPEVAHCGLLEWKKIDALVESGREAAAKALDAAPDALRR